MKRRRRRWPRRVGVARLDWRRDECMSPGVLRFLSTLKAPPEPRPNRSSPRPTPPPEPLRLRVSRRLQKSSCFARSHEFVRDSVPITLGQLRARGPTLPPSSSPGRRTSPTLHLLRVQRDPEFGRLLGHAALASSCCAFSSAPSICSDRCASCVTSRRVAARNCPRAPSADFRAAPTHRRCAATFGSCAHAPSGPHFVAFRLVEPIAHTGIPQS